MNNDIRATHAIVDLGALAQNVRNLRALLGPDQRLLAVVKADAYGHGHLQVARTALKNGASWLGVALPEEGKAFRAADIDAPILVLGGVDDRGARMVVRERLHQAVFDAQTVRRLQRWADSLGSDAMVHIKIDTGMNRVGVQDAGQLDALLDAIDACPRVKVDGAFTHFAIADEPDPSFTLEQLERFLRLAKRIKDRGHAPLLHASASSATLRFPQAYLDMVRPGISLYGYYPSAHVPHDTPLRPVLSWKTAIIHIKTIQPGETVSYGRTFTAARPTRIATLPVGYGDGYKRPMSGKAQVLIGGKRAPVVGRICMDQCMADVTEIPAAEVGSEVVLLGRQGEGRITADEMAAWADTISYEILLSINQRVPRIYIDEKE